MIKKDWSVLLSELSLASIELVFTCQLSQVSKPWSKEPMGCGKWRSGQGWGSPPSRRLAAVGSIISAVSRNVCCSAGCWDSFTETSGSCLRSVNENFARGWGRPNLSAFLTLSSWDPLIVSGNPLGKWKTEKTRREDLLWTCSLESLVLQHKENSMHVSAPEDFIF